MATADAGKCGNRLSDLLASSPFQYAGRGRGEWRGKALLSPGVCPDYRQAEGPAGPLDTVNRLQHQPATRSESSLPGPGKRRKSGHALTAFGGPGKTAGSAPSRLV